MWHFVWHDFCDWYVELKKLRFEENSGLNSHWRNLLAVFEAALRLLHPVMPFLTEELWQRVTVNQPNRPVSIALAPFPTFRDDLRDEAAEREIELLQNITGSARNLRTEMKLDPKAAAQGVLYARDWAFVSAGAQMQALEKFANMRIELREGSAPAQEGALRSAADYDLTMTLPPEQRAAQRERAVKELINIEKLIKNSSRQLGDETFVGKAPQKVVESIRAKLADYEAQQSKLKSSLASLDA